MKTCLYTMLFGCGLLLAGTSHAAPPDRGPGIPPARMEISGQDDRAIAPGKSQNDAKFALAPNKTDTARGLMLRPPSVIQPAGPLLREAHLHSPAPAAIGGPAGSQVKSTGAINGTFLNRKP
jgi:hypothetical protein